MAEKTQSNIAPRSASGGMPSPFEARDSFDRMFDQMMRGWMAPWGAAPRLDAASFDFAPRVDTAETENAYEVTAELPGVAEKDVKVTLENDVLCIAGEKKSEREEKRKDTVVSERSYGSFRRAFTVPGNVAADKVTANFENGVLKVTLPKAAAAPAKQREIPIKR